VLFQSPPSGLELKAGKNRASIACQPGSLHFYQLQRPQFGNDADIRIESMPFDEGTEAIGGRQLLVTW
jgi:hypothetical protein